MSDSDPRFGDPIGLNEVAGLTVAFKALLVRAGGRLEFTNPELEHAATVLARVEADEERMVVEVVDGTPPDIPRFGTEVRKGMSWDARRHALYASELLASAERIEREISELEPEKQLALAAAGKIKSFNDDVRHTVQSAQAHALTAQALAATERITHAETRA